MKKGVKFSEYLQFVNPEYVYIKLTPNNSIRNNNTHKIAKAVASMYKNVIQNIKREEAKLKKILGKEFMVGTKYSLTLPSKVSYYIYIEKKKAEFYFIIPRQHLSVIKERISDVWTGITIEEVKEIPKFNEEATKYQMVYAKEDPLSLATDRRDNDLLKSNLNVIDVLEQGDRVGIFYNFVPVSQHGWRSTYENTMQRIKNNTPVNRNKFGLNYIILSLVSMVSNLADNVSEVLAGESDKKKDEKHVQLFEKALERMGGRKQVNECTHKKGSDTVLDTQILVMSESGDKLRQRNNARSLTQSFDTISGDNSLRPKPFKKQFDPLTIRINGAEVNKVSTRECQNFISVPGRELLEQHGCIEKVDTKETQVPEDLRKGDIRLGTNTYRGHKQQAYLSTHKEYKQLSLILIGPNGAGKSTYLGNYSTDAIKAGECVIIFDFIRNCELSEEVSELFPKEKTLTIECSDPNRLQGLGYNEVPNSVDPFERYVNAKKQTTQLTTLVNSINADDTSLSARMNRYLTSAALVVFISAGSIKDVFSVLQNHKKRASYLNKVPKQQYENMEEYIGYLEELNDYDKDGNLKGTKLHLVEGIISRLNKLKDNPYLELMLKESTENNVNLVEEIQKNQLITIKMPESMFTTDNERDIYTTYWITKLWLALQIRSDQIKDRSKLTKVNLIIDELYQVRNTERFLTEKLSRLRKFGLKPVISCHYLQQIHQIREELRSASASYMLISGCDKKNFDELKEELYPFELDDLLNLKEHQSMNLIKNKDGYGRFITKLPPPVNVSSAQLETAATSDNSTSSRK